MKSKSTKQLANQYIEINKSLDNKDLTGDDKKVYINANKKLDKFYTKQSIANVCYEHLKSFLIQSNVQLDNVLFIEPSAGEGTFLNSIAEEKIGFDIAPTLNENWNIYQNDFLKGDIFKFLTPEQKNKQLVFIGNPPFGNKAKIAIEFINKALKYSNIVGFIIPIQFRKWSAQSKINQKARLILDIDLPENSFEFMGKDYNVRCCFQIWILKSFSEEFNDLRLYTPPPTSHPDFIMYQYNRTKEAEKFFDYDWDFAVPRQGYQDYTYRAYDKSQCNMKKQWIFFKARNQQILDRLLNLDYNKLSRKNIGIPGFGKADVIQEYIKPCRFFI